MEQPTKADVRRQKRRLKKRRGNVIFITAPPDLKKWLEDRAWRNRRSQAAEAITILQRARRSDSRK